MSFDLFYVPCEYELEPVERVNPFTGEIEASEPVQPLSANDLEAVRGVLAVAGARSPDEFGCYIVAVGDGGSAEVFASNLETGCMVALRGLTPGLLRFLFDLLAAANWVMLPTMEDIPAIVTSPGLAYRFAEKFPEVVCRSPEELRAILSGGFGAWKRYRDRAVGEGD